jgi:hypothetical protein
MEGVSTPEKAFIRGIRGCMESPNHAKKGVSSRGGIYKRDQRVKSPNQSRIRSEGAWRFPTTQERVSAPEKAIKRFSEGRGPSHVRKGVSPRGSN